MRCSNSSSFRLWRRRAGLMLGIPLLALGMLQSIVTAQSNPSESTNIRNSSMEREALKPVDMESACRQEVLDLHQFFQNWFRGELPKTDEAFDRFSGVMDDAFHIVSPGGRMTAIEPLREGLRSAHGSWRPASVESEGSRIWIENIRVQELHEDLSLVTYEEWQKKDGPAQGRLSTAVFRRDPEAPNGVRWLHVHETWLPAESGEGS